MTCDTPMQPALIPVNDLKRHAATVITDVREALEEVLVSGQYILGQYVNRFELAFADYCGTAHAVGVANGTDALELALRVAGCKAGDDVVTVANAGGYATTAIFHAGANPVYADIAHNTLLMTPELFIEAITPSTKAVIVTHLYGLMADMPALCEVAQKHNIIVIEDCAHAHGAVFEGKKAGSWGDMGCFSFYPTKNLGGVGDAGCIITNNDSFAERLRSLRQYGWQERRYHVPKEMGRNSRMDELQAAVLWRLLPYLDDWNDKRRRIIRRYRGALHAANIHFQHSSDDTNFVAHLCIARTKDRNKLIQFMGQQNIATAIHYPIPDYAQPAVVHRIGNRPVLQNTECAVSEILTLPCFPEMSEEEVNGVIEALQHFYAKVSDE